MAESITRIPPDQPDDYTVVVENMSNHVMWVFELHTPFDGIDLVAIARVRKDIDMQEGDMCVRLVFRGHHRPVFQMLDPPVLPPSTDDAIH